MKERIHDSRWNGDVVYQVYPNTFNEERAPGEAHTGRGSIRGITERRDYLHDLGVNDIWISPFYPSPMVDGGYDISDYTGVAPELGTLDDFRDLVEAYHERDMKVMIDLVPNHTSDQHPWFIESQSSPNSPKRDWYIRHDPKPDGSPPNNWSSVFSFPNLRARQNGTLIVPEGENTPPVSAWQYDPTSDQYYLCDFAREQPNLNWQNPEVREAMKEVIRTWIHRGVDGFRVDVANHLGKNPDFTDEVPNPAYREGIDNPHDQHIFYNSLNYPPTLYPYLSELTGVLDEFPEKDLRMILECWMPKEDLGKVDQVAPHLASSFNFTRLTAPWDAPTHQALLNEYYAGPATDGIPNQVLSNHDVPRVATRLGEAAARSAAVLNLTLPGMIFVYNGEEGGFRNAPIPAARRRDDGLGERDGARSPIMWNGGKNAGFSRADEKDLWLPVDPEYEKRNLEAQANDPRSFFSLYRTLCHMRGEAPTLRKGAYHPIASDNRNVVAYARRHNGDQNIVLVNFSDQSVEPSVYHTEQVMGRVILSSLNGSDVSHITLDSPVSLRPHEAVVIARSA